jgi:hypothetical protein
MGQSWCADMNKHGNLGVPRYLRHDHLIQELMSRVWQVNVLQIKGY